VDISPENVKVAEQVVAHAGLGDRVEFVVGVLGNVTKVGHGTCSLMLLNGGGCYQISKYKYRLDAGYSC
jgi:predicted O-methyltransferase YrrM